MLAVRTHVAFASLVAVLLITACATPQTSGERTSEESAAEQSTRYEAVHSWPLTESVAASALAPDGSFALLSYKGAIGGSEEALTIHRFEFEGGASSRVNVSRSRDGIMFRAVTEAKALAITEDGQSFLANWPAYLALIDSDSGVIQSVTAIPDAGSGMTSFNVLEFSPDYESAFGLGAGLVRIDMSNDALAHERDMPAPGGRSMAVLAADRAAIGNTASAFVARAGSGAPDCTVEGTISALAGSPDGTKFVGALYDQESNSTAMVIWSAADCSELLRWAPSATSVFDLAWLPNGATIASAENDGQLRFWRSSTGELAQSMAIEDGAGFKMHFSQDGSRLLTHTMWGDKTLRFFQRL